MNKFKTLGELIDSISITHNFKKEKLIFLNTSDVLEGKILVDSYMSVSKMKGQAKKTIQNGDILYSEIRPKNKRYAYIKDLSNPEDYVVSTKLMVLRNKSEELNTDYLYLYLTNQATIDYLQSRAENRIGSFPQITFEIIKVLKIWLPNIEIQNKISKILSDLNAKIELNNKINSELEAMAKLIYDYWFVQFDFPDKNGNPYKSSGGKMVYNKQLKREIPEGWEVGVFEDVLDDLQSGDRPKGGIKNIEKGIPSIGAENILSIGKYNYGDEKVIPEEFYNDMTKGIIESGDVLMYKDGASLGRVSMFKNNFPYEKCCINSHAFILRSNEKITQNYLYFWLDQDFMKEIIRRAGMRAAQPGINQVNVNELVILIPDSSIIEKFESQITSSIDKIFANAVQNKKLAELRDWLLPMLMNGQLKIN